MTTLKRLLFALTALTCLTVFAGCDTTAMKGDTDGTPDSGIADGGADSVADEGDNEGYVTSVADDVSDDMSDADVSSGYSGVAVDIGDIPAYSGSPYVVIDDNIPEFEDMTTTEAFEIYSPLDGLGRCGVAYANICVELMPTEQRGDISKVTPSGWMQGNLKQGSKWVFDRCHLIGFQLAGENANELNLITGTKAMNVNGMLPFENMIHDYVVETENHVLYRVTPVYEGDNLVADGVRMEAWSVEDGGDGICFDVFCYNAQDGVVIDYATGISYIQDDGAFEAPVEDEDFADDVVGADSIADAETDAMLDVFLQKFVLNINTKKAHTPECTSAESTKPENREDYEGTADELKSMGYDPCGKCKPF